MLDKRKLIKNIKSVYRAKGTQRGHEVFFRFLFNEDSETLYPRENILRVSDGKFDTTKILRAIGTTGDTIRSSWKNNYRSNIRSNCYCRKCI